MIAEIKGKISSTGSNLSNQLEDKLTGDFFGHLQYIPYRLVLKPILQACYFAIENKQQFLDALDSNEEFTYKFWPRYEEGEPDLILESDNAIILIEVKYQSGLSSDDEIEDPEESRHQLARESQILNRIKGNKKAFLIFLAKQSDAAPIYFKTCEKKKIHKNILFGYLSWSTALETLVGIKTNGSLSFPNDIIIKDLIDLLRKKRFERFKNFDIISDEINTGAFQFNSINKPHFTFTFSQTININYYEYR
jgi:hypothetical protein